MIAQVRPLLRRLARDEQGTTLLEFAFVAPVLCLLLMGLFDLGFQIYGQTVLQGAMQEAARKSALEPTVTTTAQLDADVTEAVNDVIPGATLAFTRTNYETFADVRKPEDYTDNNNNDVCDNGEPFEDVNGNSTWDADRGGDGLGGARDAVLYNATATFDRLFPLSSFINVPNSVTVDAGTVLRNQPYDTQTQRTPVIGNCT